MLQCVCVRVPGPSPCLCGQQFVVVGGPLVVILPVSDDGGQAFADQGLCDVSADGGERRKPDMRERHIGLNLRRMFAQNKSKKEQTADEGEGQCSQTDLKRSFNYIRRTSTTF